MQFYLLKRVENIEEKGEIAHEQFATIFTSGKGL